MIDTAEMLRRERDNAALFGPTGAVAASELPATNATIEKLARDRTTLWRALRAAGATPHWKPMGACLLFTTTPSSVASARSTAPSSTVSAASACCSCCATVPTSTACDAAGSGDTSPSSATPPAGLAFGALCSETVALSFNYGASTFLYKPMETKRRAYVCSCAAAVACVARAHGCAPLALQRREGRRPCCAQ